MCSEAYDVNSKADHNLTIIDTHPFTSCLRQLASMS